MKLSLYIVMVQSLSTTLVLAATFSALYEFKQHVEGEKWSGAIRYCKVAYVKGDDQPRLFIALNAPPESLIRSISEYPVGSLSVEGGNLHFNSLKGMDVYELALSEVSCIGPEETLSTLPLRRFDANYMTWTNINVLSQISTLSEINIAAPINAAPVNITPLARLKALNRLVLVGAWGPDLSSLAKLKLTHLGLMDNVWIRDWSALAGLPLASLDLSGSTVSDLSFVAGMRLKSLNISGTRVTDISALRDMPLESLRMSDVRVEDLTPLAGMPLQYLVFDVSAVEKGLHIPRSMSSIKLIGTKGDGRSMDTDMMSPDEFWRRIDER